MKKIVLIILAMSVVVFSKTVEEVYPNVKIKCDNGNMKQCGFLSQMSYVDGLKYKKDLQKTFRYGKMACEKNDGKGCFYLGLSYLEKHDAILAVDKFKAFEYYKQSCDLDYSGGCVSLARAYEKGLGVRLDFEQAVKYYQKAIKMGDKFSYVNLGLMYYYGQGVKRNIEKSKKFFGIACDAKLQMACDLYAEVSLK